MNLSVTDPIGRAIERTKTVLFRPFSVGKWFTMGFCAWLAHLGEGGGFSFNVPGNFSSGSGPGPAPPFGGGSGGPSFSEWFRQNQELLITLAVVGVVLFIGLGLVVLWIICRGKFMFLENVVLNRAAVKEPWKKWRRQGNSLLKFQLVLSLVGGACFLLIAGIGLLIALPDIQAERFEGMALTGVIVGGVLLVGWGITMAVVTLFLMDFVVPSMYRHEETVLPAWRRIRGEVLAGRVGTMILYVLMRIVLGMAVGMLATVATCMTCCLAGLPYLGAVILLPLSVFSRSYSVYFLEQLGGKWTFFPPEAPPEPPPAADPPGPEAAAPPPPLPDIR